MPPESRFPVDYDGRIGEGWGGVDPDGAHVNVVIAVRGTPTAAALLTTFTHPAPGHTPILVVVGEDKAHYEPVWPPTIMINKATATEERHQTITWGAGQLGIAQGVLDAVADGLLVATGDLLVFVTIYIDPAATDETAVRAASREATLKGVRSAVNGRSPRACEALIEGRDSLRSPFYSGS
ncbi:MAG: formaldehyde-activating enzyme [Solirubrobacteraceae bacterium]